MRIAIIVACVLASAAAYPQKLKSLKIGDTVPDVEIKSVVNFPSASTNLSFFRNRLLILDFWATWCSPCLASFPRLDSMQKKFGDKIQILSVTSEDKAKVSSFLAKYASVKGISPVTVTNDRVLKSMFEHTYIPHYVWIDGSGKVIAITAENEINEVNIRKILDGAETGLSEKKDKTKAVQIKKDGMLFNLSVFERVENGSTELKTIEDSNLLIQSALTKYIEGVGEGGTFRPNIIRLRNNTIFYLYHLALNTNKSTDMVFKSNTVVDIEDSVLYSRITGLYKSTGESIGKDFDFQLWKRQNTYTYELRVPPSLDQEKFSIMLEDLNRYFGKLYGIEGVKEKRNYTYLALIRTSDKDKLQTKGGTPKFSSNKYSITLQNSSLGKLVGTLAWPLQKQFMLYDETNYRDPVDMELTCNLSDLTALNKELAKYDLQIVRKEKIRETAVIRKKKGAPDYLAK